MAKIRKLDPTEIRVLGALMEKEQATPDHYPLTVNALLAACNQKTNREPVTSLSEGEVWDALDALRQDVLVWRSEGARTERWSHTLDRRLELWGPTRAILTLLFLRGPQTPGEVKSRSGRLHSFGSTDEVEETLATMSRGPDALARELPRAPGQRESRWMHLLGDDEAAAAAAPVPSPAVTADPVAAPPAAARPAPASTAAPTTAPTATPTAGADAGLAGRMAALEEVVAALREELDLLKGELGIDG